MEATVAHTGNKRPTIDEDKARGLFRAAIENKVAARPAEDQKQSE